MRLSLTIQLRLRILLLIIPSEISLSSIPVSGGRVHYSVPEGSLLLIGRLQLPSFAVGKGLGEGKRWATRRWDPRVLYRLGLLSSHITLEIGSPRRLGPSPWEKGAKRERSSRKLMLQRRREKSKRS